MLRCICKFRKHFIPGFSFKNIMMKNRVKKFSVIVGVIFTSFQSFAQQNEMVKIEEVSGEKKINVFIGNKYFTSFLYPDTLEKPVLYPVHAADGNIVTRGFPINPQPGDPTDHPHHVGIWFTYENVNGIDFWNNSYAIPKDKKHLYGWIRTDSTMTISGNKNGIIVLPCELDW